MTHLERDLRRLGRTASAAYTATAEGGQPSDEERYRRALAIIANPRSTSQLGCPHRLALHVNHAECLMGFARRVLDADWPASTTRTYDAEGTAEEGQG